MKLIKRLNLIFLSLTIAVISVFALPLNLIARKTIAVETIDLSLLESFDGRTLNYITPVKDQGSSSLCWAFSAISVAEASIIKSGIDQTATKDNLSLSPYSIGYGRYNKGSDPLGNNLGTNSGVNWLSQSGNSSIAGILFSQWYGPISSDANNKTGYENCLYRFEEMVDLNSLNTANKEDYILAIKRAVVEYGAVTFGYNNLRNTQYYNPKKETSDNYYFHACTIIGWDDTIPAESFVPNGADRNGGWLIKNSYSDNQYFYLSFDCTSANVYAFRFAPLDKYDFNYFYDDSVEGGGLIYSLNPKEVSNIFEAKKATNEKDEIIKAVNFSIYGVNTKVQVNIYTNLSDENDPESGTLVSSKQQTFEYPGYYTIELDSPAKIEKGSKFSVIAKIIDGSESQVINISQNDSQSFIKKNGTWSKMNNFTARIKAYTALVDKSTDSEPINPVDPDPVTPDPVTPDPVTPDPVDPDPITPNPITPETPTINPDQSENESKNLNNKEQKNNVQLIIISSTVLVISVSFAGFIIVKIRRRK